MYERWNQWISIFPSEVRRTFIFLFISVCAGIARCLVTSNYRPVYFIRGLFLAAFAGALTNLGLESSSLSEGTRGLIVGVVAFSADDILMGLVEIGSAFKKDPYRFISLLCLRLIKRKK